MQVLIVKTSSMGDIFHTLPSLTDAMQKVSDVRFNWIVEENFVQIPAWHRAVEKVIPVAIRRWRNSWFSNSVKSERKAFLKEVRMQHYDAVIDAQGLIKSALLITRFAHGVKHGLDWKTAREPLASLFYSRSYHISKQQHAVERIRELFAKSLGYVKPHTCGNYAILQHFLHKLEQKDAPYIIFLHSTTRNDKHWPETHWRKLIKLIQPNRLNVKLLWWNENERQRAQRIARGFPYVEILPKLSLAQIAEKFLNSRIIVSVDTGLSHLAAALDRPNITLFGPTNPKFIGGYGKNQYQIVSPTHKMNDITADKIVSLLRDQEVVF